MKRRPRRSKTCSGPGRAAQQISCQSCVVVLYLFLQRRPGGDRRADRRSLNRGVLVAGIAAREGPDGKKRSRPEMAPQRLEKIESAPGNGMGSEALNPQDVVHGRAADRARLRLASRGNDEAKFSASQPTEIAQSCEGISESAPRISPPRSYEEGGLRTRGRLPKRSAPHPLPSRAGRRGLW